MSWWSFVIGFFSGAPIWATFGVMIIALLKGNGSDDDE